MMRIQRRHKSPNPPIEAGKITAVLIAAVVGIAKTVVLNA